MKDQKKLVVFRLDEQLFALPLSTVERVVRIVEVTPLPKSPDYILGVINFHGEIIPVVNVRRIFNLPEREVELTDKLIIAQTSFRTVSLWIDSVNEVIEIDDEEVIKSEKIFLGIDFVKGVFKLDSGIVLIHDLDKFLTIEETNLLKAALHKQREIENAKELPVTKKVDSTKKRRVTKKKKVTS